MSFIVRICACLLLVIVAGCGELPLEPSAVTGAWALETVDGQPLPATSIDEATASVYIIADTLELASDGTFGGRRCEVRVNHDTDSETAVCVPYSGTYTLRVRTLELWYACLLSSDCYGSTSRTGTVRDGRLVLSEAVAAPGMEYGRVD